MIKSGLLTYEKTANKKFKVFFCIIILVIIIMG